MLPSFNGFYRLFHAVLSGRVLMVAAQITCMPEVVANMVKLAPKSEKSCSLEELTSQGSWIFGGYVRNAQFCFPKDSSVLNPMYMYCYHQEMLFKKQTLS
jgi:hypothetical protein